MVCSRAAVFSKGGIKIRKVTLKNIIKRQEVASILGDIAPVDELVITDPGGKALIGNNNSGKPLPGCPVKLGEEVIGWVMGGEKAETLAKLLSYLAVQELEKRSLARETLEKYKEISVIYDITEKLAASLDPKQVSQLIVGEAKRLIQADNISVMVIDEDTGLYSILAASGTEYHPKIGFQPGKGIAGSIIASGKGEIVNDVISDPRYIRGTIKISSMMCAPLKIKDRVIGAINVSSAQPLNYTAEDLKILSALALQSAAAIENARLYDRLKDTFLTAVYTLAETIEKRDPYTGGHTKRVMQYSLAIGKELGLADGDMERLRLAAILHDVGKIGIRDNILLKSSKLTLEEFSLIKMHTIYGQQVLKHIKYFKDIIPGVMYHHERFDGKGYPEGLRGEEIDIIARIIAVADSYDAMTTDRPYRKGLCHEAAVEELKRCSGSQWDSDVVEAFLRIDVSQTLGGGKLYG
ncbi:HD-GYP domain [Desulfocucumis palustris]|uniref:HD-GYP domain n=1 Tax=Desulfocucumis palustris TaxID=1898651 RepID=A0A2L2XA02_9FIRM|nr:HD domain-containing phosphohydrolase [Desulfocucumis palustris]GBF33089.1 HD-GYP domain [Desulfocucumis palustris]